jgi:hypothetical protein
VPLLLFSAYVMMGALARLAFIYETRPGVWLGATLAVLSGIILYATCPHPAMARPQPMVVARGVRVGDPRIGW